MTLRLLRPLLLTAVVLTLAAPVAAVAASAEVVTDRGVVQSVTADRIVLRELDGSTASLAVGPKTRVKVNGLLATLTDIRPGFVATVVHNGAKPAQVVRAFGTTAVVTDRGTVTALSKQAITIRTAAGATVTVGLDPATRFRFRGLPAKRFAARPGAFVAVKHLPNGTATVVNVLKRAPA